MNILLTIIFMLFPLICNAALLTGQTPANHNLPSGWSLVRTQDFEGSPGSGENWTQWGTAVQTDRYHGGSKSLGGTYSQGQDDKAWRLDGSAVGIFTEIYLSFYEFIESQALFNDEFFLARFGIDSPFQEVLADWYWAPGFNKPSATLYQVSQGVRSFRNAEKSATVPKGAWHQWEIHYRPNTAGSSNGFYRVYLDGNPFLSAENANINATVNMNSANVQVGGVYTKGVWMTDYPTCSVPSGCSTYPGNGTDYCSEHMHLPSGATWSSQLFSKPVCYPIDPPLASFKRYFDDIILMKLVGPGGGPDVQPPYTTNQSPAAGATGVPTTQRTISFSIRDDRTDDTGILQASVQLSVNGVNYTCYSGLSCSGSGYYFDVSRVNGSDWSNNQVVNIIATATDASGNVMNQAWSFTTITTPTAVDITTTSLDNGTVGVIYPSAGLTATGGTTPYTWALLSGSLPVGLGINSSGVISGTPTVADTSVFTVSATDTLSVTDNQVLSITIVPYVPGGTATVTITSIEDTSINAGQTSTNHSTETINWVYAYPDYTNEAIILARVPLSLPDNILIISSSYSMYSDDYDGTYSPVNVYAHRVSGTLPTISTVTWSSFTGTLNTYESVVSVPWSISKHEWDVTSAVTWAYANSSDLYLALTNGISGYATYNRKFRSMEYATTIYRPQLVITYMNLVGPSGPSISAPGKLRISNFRGTFH